MWLLNKRAIKQSRPNLFYQTLNWQIYFRFFFQNNKEKFLKALQKDFKTDNVFLTNAGRAGIVLSMKAARLGRHDEIFVPHFMSSCVLSAICEAGHPSLSFTKKTKAVLLYHHWGYTQDFQAIKKILKNRKVIIIEDCAHGLWGKSYGIKIGEFGDTAIFSLSKVFETTYAGALRVNNQKYLSEIKKQLDGKTSLKEYWEALMGEWTYLYFYNLPIKKRSLKNNSSRLNKWYATLITYPACKMLRGKLPRDRKELKAVFKAQNSNFLFLLNNLKNKSFLLNGDDLKEMAPLCYPFFNNNESVLKRVDRFLKKRGIYTGIYNFDINRNMFKPNFKKCVPIPIYASIDKSLLESFVKKFKAIS